MNSNNKLRLLTRREFVTRGIGMMAVAATIPSFLNRTAILLADPIDSLLSGSHNGKILVVIQLSGGNDGLNTVVPFAFDSYYRARPTLGVPKDRILRINDEIGLNPNLSSLKGLYDSGRLAIVQG